MPHWASSEKSPAVLSTTVLPPALGPETTRSLLFRGQLEVERNGVAPFARLAENASAQGLVAGVEQRVARAPENPAVVVRDLGEAASAHLAEGDLRLERVERREALHRVAELVGLRQDLAAELAKAAARLRAAPRPAVSARSLLDSMTSSGSTKTVWPEPERSCTIPGTRPRAEAWTGRQ